MRQGRPGIFGPVTVSIKAGDDAPNIEFTKVLHAPGTAQWSSSNAFSQTTVLVFLPLMSRNPQQVDLWNALVDRFAARSVQLVLITKEPEPTLLPWLAQHPVSGWLFPPSYEVHIAPSGTLGTTSTSAPDYWSMGGFDLKAIVARAYGVEETRVDFRDAAAPGKRYDVALVLPQAEDGNTMLHRIQDALKEKFNLSIASENKPMQVYVVTAPYGPGPELHPSEDSMGGFIGSSSGFVLPKGQESTPENTKNAMDQQRALRGITVDSISVSGGTIEKLCKELERGLDRKVIDETHLTGRYDFNVVRGDRTRDEFFDMLREQLGLAVTPEQRDVPMLVVRSNSASDSALR